MPLTRRASNRRCFAPSKGAACTGTHRHAPARANWHQNAPARTGTHQHAPARELQTGLLEPFLADFGAKSSNPGFFDAKSSNPASFQGPGSFRR